MDDDLPSLARACRALLGADGIRHIRTRSSGADQVIPDLCRKTFARAVLRVGDACAGTDEAMPPVTEALRAARCRDGPADRGQRRGWRRHGASLTVIRSIRSRPGRLGCCIWPRRSANRRSSQIVGQRLSNTLEPDKSASFLTGFLDVNALVIIKNRPVVEALDAFIQSIEADRFRNVLPTLRRAFAVLGATERRYLLENVLAIRNLSGHGRSAQQILSEKDREKLKSIAGDLSKTIDELDDLL